MQIDTQYLGVIGAILAHAFASVWWASKINATMLFQKEILSQISKTLIHQEATKYDKEAAVKDFAVRDTQIEGLWKKVDKLQGI